MLHYYLEVQWLKGQTMLVLLPSAEEQLLFDLENKGLEI